jgi:agmatine/peptidylarginine deiminase
MIYNGPDRVIAMKIKSEFNRNFPGMRSYMNYNVPNFKIKVGDFEDKKEAYKFLKRITPLLPTSSVVPDAVTVKNILVQ